MDSIFKEILPSKLTFNNVNNIKLIKRKLNIYNFKNSTDYKLEDLEIKVLNGHVFYYYKQLDEKFDIDKLDVYKKNHLKVYPFIKEDLKECKKYKMEGVSNCVYLFKNERFFLKQDLINNIIYISHELLWSKIQLVFGYNWLEISNLYNNVLEHIFNVRPITTFSQSYLLSDFLELEFKRGKFTSLNKR